MCQDKAKTSFLKTFIKTSGEVQIGITRKGFGKGVSGTGEIVSIIFGSIKDGEIPLKISSGSLETSGMIDIPVEYSERKIITK